MTAGKPYTTPGSPLKGAPAFVPSKAAMAGLALFHPPPEHKMGAQEDSRPMQKATRGKAATAAAADIVKGGNGTRVARSKGPVGLGTACAVLGKEYQLWLWASLICSPRARSRWSKAALTAQQVGVSSPGTRGLGRFGALGWIQWRARPSYGSSSSHDDE